MSPILQHHFLCVLEYQVNMCAFLFTDALGNRSFSLVMYYCIKWYVTCFMLQMVFQILWVEKRWVKKAALLHSFQGWSASCVCCSLWFMAKLWRWMLFPYFFKTWLVEKISSLTRCLSILLLTSITSRNLKQNFPVNKIRCLCCS